MPSASMRFVRGRGLSIAEARHQRIEIRDGELIVRRPYQSDEVVESAGSLTSAVLLDYDQFQRLIRRRTYLMLPFLWVRHITGWALGRQLGFNVDDLMRRSFGGVMVLSGPDGPVLTVHLGDFAAWVSDPQQTPVESGAAELARSLGLELERANDSDLPSRWAMRRALIGLDWPSRHPEMWDRAAWLLTTLAGVFAFLSMPYAQTTAGIVFSAAALACFAPILATMIRHRHRFDRLVNQPPDPHDRVVYRPPASVVGTLDIQLQLGEHDIVLVNAGDEWWIPGPAADGIVSYIITQTTTTWLDAHDQPRLVLDTHEIAPDDDSRRRLEDALATVGISASSRYSAIVPDTSLSLRHQDDDPGLRMSEWERGRASFTAQAIGPLAAVIHLAGALIITAETGFWAMTVGSVAWLAITVWAELHYRTWRRTIRRRANETGSDTN